MVLSVQTPAIGSKKLVIDLFAHLDLRLFTIGRLDRDTQASSSSPMTATLPIK